MSGVFAAFGREVRKRSKAEGIVIGKEQELGIAHDKERCKPPQCGKKSL